MGRSRQVVARFTTANKAEALAWIQKAQSVFADAAPDVYVDWGAPACGEAYGCYNPGTNIITFNPDGSRIPMYVVAHEFGHFLEKSMSGSSPECSTYLECEGFARYFESIYLATDGRLLDFQCDCGQTHLRVLPDGSIECVDCRTLYYAPLFNPLNYQGTYRGQGQLMYPDSREQLTTSSQLSPAVAQIAHASIGALFVLAPAAARPDNPKWVRGGAVAGSLIATGKELLFDPLVEGQNIAQGAVDLAFYGLGILGGLALLKRTGHRV